MEAEGLETRLVQRRFRASREPFSAAARRAAEAAASHSPAPSSLSRTADDLAEALLSGAGRELEEHSRQVETLAAAIARRLGLRRDKLEEVVVAARLHDVGKREIPESLIGKPGPLSSREWELIRRHTLIGEELVSSNGVSTTVAKVVRHSHERWDGRGYPDGLRGERIPLGSRIVFCADSFDAICSDRSYQSGRSVAEALAELRRSAGTQLDPKVVQALSDVVRPLLYGAPHQGRRRRGRSSLALLVITCLSLSGSALASLGDPGSSGGSNRSEAPAAISSPPPLYSWLELGASDSSEAAASSPADTRGDQDPGSSRESGENEKTVEAPSASAPVVTGSSPWGGGSSQGHGRGHSNGRSQGGGNDHSDRGRGQSRGRSPGNSGSAPGHTKPKK